MKRLDTFRRIEEHFQILLSLDTPQRSVGTLSLDFLRFLFKYFEVGLLLLSLDQFEDAPSPRPC